MASDRTEFIAGSGVEYPAGLLPMYLARIGYTGPSNPTLSVLHQLISCHLANIAFESLDPFLGIPVQIDLASIQAKLVCSRRGGYCHENNALFYNVLGSFGFAVTPLAGRVVWGRPRQVAPLTHRLTLVEMEEGNFIADVGFGGNSPPAPIRLKPGLEQPTSHGVYRVLHADRTFQLQMLKDRWETIYRFSLAPQTRSDFEVANWYSSTHPRSLFTQNLVVCRVVGPTRINLLNADLVVRHRNGDAQQRALQNAQELRKVLEDVMDLAPPAPSELIWAKIPKQTLPFWP
jgi:N-hydroxyarylamine O-acetyltransferase